MVRRVLEQSGLTLVEPIYFGHWCGRKGTITFQDLTVSERKSTIRASARSTPHLFLVEVSFFLFQP